MNKKVVLGIVAVVALGAVVGIPVYRFATRDNSGVDPAAHFERIDRDNDAAPAEVVATLSRLQPRLRAIGEAVEGELGAPACEAGPDAERATAPLITRGLLRATLQPAPIEGADQYWNPLQPQADYEVPVRISDGAFRGLSEYLRVASTFASLPAGASTRRRPSAILREAREELDPALARLDAAASWVVFVAESRQDPRIESPGFVPGRVEGRAYVFDGSRVRCSVPITAANSDSVAFTRTIVEGGGTHDDAYGQLVAQLTTRTREAVHDAIEATTSDLTIESGDVTTTVR